MSFPPPEPADLATLLSRTDCSDDVRFAEVLETARRPVELWPGSETYHQAFQGVHDVAFDLEANLKRGNLGFGEHGASS